MKRTALALMAVALVPLAAACGSDDKASSTTAAATTAAPTTAAATTVAPTTAAATTTAKATTTTAAKATTTTAKATSTSAAAATTTAGAAPPFADPDQQAAATAFTLVYDSTVPFEQKAAHLVDAEALQATIEAYTTAGSAMGGISLAPSAVTIDGDTATVIYDVMFGPAAAYQDLDGTITKDADGTWQVARADFCAFMAQARTPCA